MKYLIVTNILSESRKQSKMDASLLAWLDRTAQSDMATSVLVLAEIKRGVERIRRKDAAQARNLQNWLDSLKREYAGRILPVTEDAAYAWASMNVPNPLPAIDGLIGATAKVHGLVLVTRNARDFARTKVSVLNPFAQ